MSPPKTNDEFRPGFVDTLEPKTLADYALSIRNSDPSFEGSESLTCITELPPVYGSKNMVFSITFSDGARWALRIPFPPYSELMEERMRADIATMRLIQTRTELPIPKIHAALPTVDSPLGVPFILMDWANGVRLEDVWYDRKWRTEPRTRGVIESLVSHMAALSTLEFASIGTLVPQDAGSPSNTWTVGAFIDDREETLPDSANLNNCGPYSSVHAYYIDTIDNATRKSQSRHGRAQLALLRMLGTTLPSFEFDSPPFSLSHPDLRANNVFVDPATGVITAMIDWDGVNTGPRQSGCARYPSWMTRDMDPVRYTWKATYGDFIKEPVQSVNRTRPPSPVPPEHMLNGSSNGEQASEEGKHDPFTFDWNESLSSSDASSWSGDDDDEDSKSSVEILRTEESPSELALLRKTYHSFMTLLYPSLAPLTARSHISEAIERAIFDPESRTMINTKLFEELVGPGDAWWVGRVVRKGLWNGTWLSNGWVGPVARGVPPTEVLSGGEVDEADDEGT